MPAFLCAVAGSGAEALLRIAARRGQWSWLDRLALTKRIGRSLYVFDVSDDDVPRLAATELPANAEER